MKSAPCRDCDDRQIGCAADCERYREFRAEQDKVNAKRAEAKRRDTMLYEFKSDSIEKVKRRH